MDIHNYKRQLERNVELIKENKEISAKNKQFSIKFRDYLLSEGIGVAKIGRYMLDVRTFALILNKPFDKATKEDLRSVVAEIEQKEWSAETKKCFKVMIRKFYKFIRGVDEKGVYPDEVRWISINIPRNHKKLPEQLLSEEDIASMIQNCNNLRDKTLISILYESGCRIGEILTLKIKNISFEKYGARLTVTGKTGMRKILVINSTPYLKSWINDHPSNDDQESFLWLGPNKSLISYARVCSILKDSAKKAGIKKRIYPHLFRHSRATHLANKMTEASMKSYFGWGQDSKMCATYIHMNSDLTDEAILRANGIEIRKENTQVPTEPKKCLKCKAINEFTNKFCKICGMVLDKKEAEKILKEDAERQRADNIMDDLIKDPEILNLIKKKMSMIV